MNNVFSFSILGKLNIRTQLNSAYRNDLIKHNNQVDKNRYVLNKIINCIRFCGAFELALRGHDEKENSENRGIFKELVNFSAELDNELKVHIQSAKLFKGTSKTTQNELLECMLDVYHEEVKKEIANSPFVAVIADETTDVACEFQYLCKGQPVERFWSFYVPDGHDAKSIAACVLNVVNPLIDQNPNKLIAQSYDGASVMSANASRFRRVSCSTQSKAMLRSHRAAPCNSFILKCMDSSVCGCEQQFNRIILTHCTSPKQYSSAASNKIKIKNNVENPKTVYDLFRIGNSSRARKRSRDIVKAVSDLKSLHEQVNSAEENPLDVFGKSVASQLKTFSVENALLAQCRIQSLLSEIGIKDYREKSAPNNSSQRSSSVFSNFTDVNYTSTASTDHVTNRFDDLTSESDTLRTTNDILTLAMVAACDSDMRNEQV
ncbi:unnamed protein product [Acanthoscelides obtectus]|uniref:DUF4371 domain-containing protein n=1 Tax=Acanthoscelides obtectus TaxID=200917 RepID=A0A9P0MAC8_ACAOB|nr:unnamed protein product [Acanthoscelides obtectus]CAK1671937.1 hypothetical protein AOBTE_LOCUS28547 [Acanthoscelides obtectus]